MAQLFSIVQRLTQLLDPASFHDSAYNGLQVDSGHEDISLAAFAVDAGMSVIEEALDLNAHLLIVHHGIIWGGQMPINGTFGRKVRALIQGGCSLYASHLPLDANPEVGNNFELARFFELCDYEPFCEHEGRAIGVKALCPEPAPLEFFSARAAELTGATQPLVLPFGAQLIEKVGILSGGGAFALQSAIDEGLDLLITGEPRQESYHLASEAGINVIFAGHYATETTGVLALKMTLEKDFGIGTVFINKATGI